MGYRYHKSEGGGKLLVRGEPHVSITQEALEGYARGRSHIQAEVKRFLESRPEFSRDKKDEFRDQRVTELLTRVTYTGYALRPGWSIYGCLFFQGESATPAILQRLNRRILLPSEDASIGR